MTNLMNRARTVTLAVAALTTLLALPTIARADRDGRHRGGRHADRDRGGNLGLGLILGEPTGLSAKLLLSERNALDFGLGFGSGYYDDRGWRFHMDYLWHPAIVARSASFTLPFYVGVGGLIGSDRHRDTVGQHHTFIGPRIPLGLDLYFREAPFDVFFEVAFAMVLNNYDSGDHADAWLEGAVGARYYF